MSQQEAAVPVADDSVAIPARSTPTNAGTRLSQADLSRRWQVATATLERWRSTGMGPPFMKLAGQVRYRIEDVLAFEAASLRTSTATSLSGGDRP